MGASKLASVQSPQYAVERSGRRVGRHLERRGLLVCDAENAWLDWDSDEPSALDDLAGHAISYRTSVGPKRGQKAFPLQTLPAVQTEPSRPALVARAGGFSLHAGVAAEAYISGTSGSGCAATSPGQRWPSPGCR